MTTSSAPGGTVPINGRDVPRIGYGMGRASHAADTPDAYDRSLAALRQAVDGGIRLFDTAQFYDDGRANRLLREAVGWHRDDIVYATKVGARPLTGGPVPMTAAQRPPELREAVEENLRTLGTDRLDVVYMRRMDFLPGIVVEEGEQRVPLADQLAELVALRDEGKVLGIGLSHVTLEQLREALPVGLAAVSNIHSLLVRRHEDLLRLCVESSIAWIPYFPLGGGYAFDPLPRTVDDPVVREIAEETGATPAQVGAAWMLGHAPGTVMISGTVTPSHLDENIAAGDLVLTADQRERLDARADDAS